MPVKLRTNIAAFKEMMKEQALIWGNIDRNYTLTVRE
jgi:hypothetical protein